MKNHVDSLICSQQQNTDGDTGEELIPSSISSEGNAQIVERKSQQHFTPLTDNLFYSSLNTTVLMKDEPKNPLSSESNQYLLSPVTLHTQGSRGEHKDLGPEYQRRGRFLVWPVSLGLPFGVST